MRNSRIPLHIKQAAYTEYINGHKVVDILEKYNICFGTLYSFIHKQEQISKTFRDNQSESSPSKSISKSKTTRLGGKSKSKTTQLGGKSNILQLEGKSNIDILSIDAALLELEKL
jgi:uncharacterized protein YjcR